MADMTPITYGADAHTAERMDTPRQDESEHSRRFRLSAASGQRLPHRCPTVDLFPMRALQDIKPAKLREIEQMPGHTPRPTDRPEHPLRWDEECLRYTSQTKRNFFFGLVRGFGWIGLFTLFPISVLVVIYGAYERQTSQVGFLSSLNWELPVAFFLIFSFMWGGGKPRLSAFPQLCRRLSARPHVGA